jgi:hypothetical protein
MEETKMCFNKKHIATILAAITLFGGASAYAATPAAAIPSTPAPWSYDSAYASERASKLLSEIQAKAGSLTFNADTLNAIARHPQHSRHSHAYYLHEVKTDINAIGNLTAELQRLQGATLPWQQQAITEVTNHAAQVAASTQAAILHLNANPRGLWAPEYREHVASIADASQNVKSSVDKFLDYEKTQQKFQRLQYELELSPD